VPQRARNPAGRVFGIPWLDRLTQGLTPFSSSATIWPVMRV